MLIYLGAFAEKNAFEDMLVVLFFGGLGWVMEKLEWPRPPVLLGLVLGPLAENRLFLSSRQLRTRMARRPGVLIIFAITLLGIIYPILKNKWGAKASQTAGYRRRNAESGNRLEPARPPYRLVIILLALALSARPIR